MLSSKAHHLQHSLSREGISSKDPQVRLHSASRAHHLHHNSRLEGLSVTKRPSSSTTLSSKAYHLQHNLSREGLSANQRPSSLTTLSSKVHHLQHSLSREGISTKDTQVRLHSASRAHNLQHNSRLEGLSVTKRPSSSTTPSSKAYHLQHNLSREGLFANQRPSSSTTLSSKAHHLQHSLSREGLSAKDPRVRLHSASRAHHLQHNSRLEGLSVTKRLSSSTTLSSKAYHLQHNLTSRAHHLQHNSRLEGLSGTKRPSSLTTLSSKAYHLQHNLSREGLFFNQRPSSSTTLSSKLKSREAICQQRFLSSPDPRSLNREEDRRATRSHVLIQIPNYGFNSISFQDDIDFTTDESSATQFDKELLKHQSQFSTPPNEKRVFYSLPYPHYTTMGKEGQLSTHLFVRVFSGIFTENVAKNIFCCATNIRQIREFMHRRWTVTVGSIPRADNALADRIAKHGRGQPLGRAILGRPPPDVQRALDADLKFDSYRCK
ncbi:hypothetical protein F3Y22_tig00008013pilonHSYRG00020 [Hibiscus syriacus]|uniref:Uncharacterized protein n=1 Tax=Hibiscus syriacus TaxID=106335 RepID=A0A6A3CDP5_HIBSY|nr:hypothetical protein F3Y22_tig00008013pilonHSYRG00020 [Hibiscus syriacus]